VAMLFCLGVCWLALKLYDEPISCPADKASRSPLVAREEFT
jgi:hypothetical protein